MDDRRFYRKGGEGVVCTYNKSFSTTLSRTMGHKRRASYPWWAKREEILQMVDVPALNFEVTRTNQGNASAYNGRQPPDEAQNQAIGFNGFTPDSSKLLRYRKAPG